MEKKKPVNNFLKILIKDEQSKKLSVHIPVDDIHQE